MSHSHLITFTVTSHFLAGEQHHRLSLLSTQCYFLLLLLLLLLLFSPGTKVYLNKGQLSWRINQLTSLLQLYASQIQWLSCGSRLYFGQLHRTSNVAVLFDWSDHTCFSDWYEQYLVAIETPVEEQLASRDDVYMIPVGSQISNPVLHNMRNKGYEQHLVFDSISFHFSPPSPPSSLSGVWKRLSCGCHR